MTAVSLRLPEDLGRRLDRLSEETGRSKTFYMLEAIKEYLEDIEDIYLAESRLAEIKAGRVQTVPYAEVRRHIELEN